MKVIELKWLSNYNIENFSYVDFTGILVCDNEETYVLMGTIRIAKEIQIAELVHLTYQQQFELMHPDEIQHAEETVMNELGQRVREYMKKAE